jgi:Protein of unknown function (DUF3667)
MIDDFSSAADIVTGAVIANAIEPATAHDGGTSVERCLNCQTLISGHHCHSCGQKAKVHRTLGAFWHDILHSVLHFDGKIWRTLPLLAWRPGDLTRRYVHGERARFVSPIALFLFTVFFTFAVVKGVLPNTELGTDRPVTAAKAAQELAKDRADLIADIKELEEDKVEAKSSGDSVAWIDAQLARSKATLTKIDSEKIPAVAKQGIAERRFATSIRKAETAIARLEAARARAVKAGQSTTLIDANLADERMGVKMLNAATSVLQRENGGGGLNINLFGNERLNKAAKHAAENPQLLLYKIQSNAYKYSWALVPISTPFLWLLFFWRREFKMFDHAVFVTYSLCFMMTLGALVAVVASSSEKGGVLFGLAMASMVFVPPIHMYRQLKQAYQITRLGAVWRAGALSIFSFVALTLFAALIISLGVTG